MIAPPGLPSHDDAELLIKEARERQLRRRLLVAAGVAIVAALGLSVYALTFGDDGQTVTTSRSATGAPPLCRSAQLSSSAGFQGATQSMLGGAGITNTSESACSLPAGRPAVHISWQGRTLALRERGPSPVFPAGRALQVLAPSATATVYLQWWNYCGPAVDIKVPPVVHLRFANRLSVNARGSAQWGVPYCIAPNAVSTLYVSDPRRSK